MAAFRKRWTRIALAATVGLILGSAATVLVLVHSYYQQSPRRWPLRVFTAAEWKTLVPEERYVFVNDLMSRRVLDGMTRQNVAEVLGEPSFRAPDGRYVTYIVKYVGSGELSMISVYLFHVEFDDAGRVRSYRVRSD